MLMNSSEYISIVENIKREITGAQYRAAVHVNADMLLLYYDIGCVINEHKSWGNKFIDNLASDIRVAFPESKGYSVRNLKYMAKFAARFPNREFVQEALAQITWYHHIALMDKVKFGKDPTLFNTGKNSATVYKLSNMNDDLMDEINSMVDEKNHTAVADRCKALLENGCEFEFVGFPVAARAGCKTFEENLDILNPRLGDTIDYILRTHFLTDETARDVEDMVDIVIEHNPCSLTRPKEKYQYMMKSFLYASYCGLTAGTLWDGKSQVNGGFIAVDEKGNVTANLALESEGFKSYLFKHCYFEWPATSENHGNYARVYKEGEDYYFRLNFQIRYR